MESLRAEETNARKEVERLKARRGMVEAAQRNLEALVESYAQTVPGYLDTLTPEERHEVYRMLGLRIRLDNTGVVEIGGVVRFLKKGNMSTAYAGRM